MSSPTQYKVFWSFRANENLADIYEYIEQESPQAANKVIDTLLDLGNSLSYLPHRFPIEQNLKDAPLIFRFIPKWNYKIVYTVNEEKNLVIINQIFDTRQSLSKFTA